MNKVSLFECAIKWITFALIGYLMTFAKPFKSTFSVLLSGFNISSHALNSLNKVGMSQSFGSFIINTMDLNFIMCRVMMYASDKG